MSVQFETAFREIFSDTTYNPDWLKDLRQKSYDQFLKAGFPTRQNEDWKYTSTRALAELNFQKPALAKVQAENLKASALKDGHRLVFLNGLYQAKESTPPSDVTVTALHEAEGPDRDLVRSALASEEHLSVLNQAFFTSGVLIKVKKNTTVSKPIQLLYLQTESAVPAMTSPRNLIFVESGAQVSFLETHQGQAGNFTNAVSDIFVKDAAECQFVLERVLRPENLFVSSHTFHIGRDARAETFNLAIGGQINRSHLVFRMTAPGAYAKLDGLYIAQDGSHIDNVTEVQHLAAHTSSAQLYKGILEGKSRAVFNGKITIVKDAQQVDAQQLNKNLLMSREAEVDSRPQLIIDANDVKCSHGATIGQIDAQELFYLQSRAIPKDEAKRMLAKAFIGDVIGRIKNGPFRDHLETTLDRFGNRANGS